MLRAHGPIPELSVLNGHPRLIDGPRLLHELVHTSSNTNAPAIDFQEDESRRRILTYEELHASSDALAKSIVETLARLEDPSVVIPVLLAQSPELYIALLAILKAGKAFCPIGLDTPKERLDFILQDVSASVVITDAARRVCFPPSTGLEVLLVGPTISGTTYTSAPKTFLTKPAHLAYVLYTSGSTGIPKAVSVSHLAVTQSMLAHDRHIPRFSRFLQFAAPTFDVSIFEVFFTLYRGCTLVGCERSQMLNDLPGVITSLEVDAAELTPTVVSNLLRGRKSVPGLRLLLTIGEMLTRNVIDEFGGHGAVESILWGMYGPTEAAIHCTLQPSFPRYAPVSNIGFPLDTVSAFIVAPVPERSPCSSIKILPFGDIGELAIGGPQIADEYLNRPELSASSFIKHPEYGVLYRTGDKARLRSDYTLECLGRIVSGQVKLRGQRVELGEIEQIILSVDACHSAAVTVIEDTLVAFCASKPGGVSNAVILSTCKRWLPNYMVPTEIILLEQMPQLPSGKIDKSALQTHYERKRHQNGFLSTELGAGDDCPITRTVQDTLGRNVPLDAELGIDSLRSIRIASSLRAQGYSVGPIDILSAPNLESLITVCERGKNSHIEPGESPSISPDLATRIPELQGLHSEIMDIFPCTPLQEAMLAETNMRPSAYCNWIEIEIHKPQSFPQIRGLLQELARRNEILRSGFLNSTITSGSFLQVVWKELAISAIQEVSNFSRTYSLGSVDSLLRPFAVQVLVNPHRPRLLFQIHHGLYDGWSIDLILQDFSHLMSNRIIGTRPQYREVLKYYLQLQESESLAKSRAYWAKMLHNYHPKALPNFNGKVIHRNGISSVRGECAVNPQALVACADEHAINPQVFFQTAIGYILSLYHGSSDVVIGTVTSGRTIPVTNVENIVGPCIASVPFRMDHSGSTLIKHLLHKTQRTNRDMLQHCTLPLRDIAKTCNIRPGEQLFDVLFVWQQPLFSTDSDVLELAVVDSADDLEFKLTLEFEPRIESVLYRITYDPSLLPESQIKYLVRQIDQVVNHFVATMNGQVDDVVKCFSTELVSVANPRPVLDVPRYGPADAVEKRAKETPNKDALIVGTMVDGVMCIGEKLTYAALNSRANRLARVLVEHGAGRDQPVGILMEKSADFYVSVLAVLKIGCGYLPITPDTPTERTKTILADAEVAICISNSSCSTVLQLESLTTLTLDQLDLSPYSDHDLSIPYNGSHLAYAIFTSGSTGKPKGVLVTQGNLMSNLMYLSSLYPTPSGSRILQSCSQAFDVSVFEIFFSWHVGMCLCAASMSEIFYDFEAAIDSLGITHLSLTPTVAALVDPNKVPKVKFLVTAGEALTENVRRKWAGKGLFQGYGPSETTNICTAQPSVTAEVSINNIGKPFPNTSALVMVPDKDCVVPRGAIGELCFGGAQVFRGYLKRPELNAQKIIDHPLHGRIYRSGDMGIMLPDDSILFTGRIDDQVKIRGQRVELGEITSLVLDHPSVEDCTTLLHYNGKNAQRLVTFWVPAKLPTTTFEALPPTEYRSCTLDLFETLSLKLPVYMVPTHLVPISQIPMTPQAKVDRRRLRTTFDGLPATWLDHIALRHDMETNAVDFSNSERQIAEVLAQTLAIHSINVRRASSFFSLGLDSISAIRFAKGLRDAGFGHFPVSTVFKNPSVERLSSVIAIEPQPDSKGKDPNWVLENVFEQSQILQIISAFRDRGIEVEKILPCTPLQEAMLASASPSKASYYNTMVFRVNGQLDRLRQCWALMLKRHEIFRTTFVSTDHLQYAFAQVVLAPELIQWDQLGANEDVSTYVKEVLPTLLRAHRPPIRLAMQGTGSSKRLIFCCHHALYDGTAISTLLSEIQENYLGRELPPPIPYERYLRYVVTQDLEAADGFWNASLARFQPTFFPNISPKPQNHEPQTTSIARTLQTPLSNALEHCQSNSFSLLAMMQAAWAKLLHFCMGENDICFGNVVSARTLSEDGLDRLVAPCFNTLPVRFNFSTRGSNIDMCHRLHSCNIDSLSFQLTPLRRIQSKVLREQGRLFDTLFILQQPITPLNDSIWGLEEDIGKMDFPLVCEVFQNRKDDILKLVLHYSDALLQQQDAKVLAETFDNALQTIVHFPNAPTNDTVGFPVRLLSQFNMNFRRLEPPQRELLHSAFELNAIQQPDAIALDFYDASGQKQTFTFRTLNEKANQIAHALIEHGIGLEDIVPVHISKSPQFYASVIGVLKAGAAFTPVHPDLPEARKRFMVSELRPKTILCLTSSLDWSWDIPVLNVAEVASHAKENPKIRGLHPTSLAYCLYTSGSTGVPKAVSMEHRAPLQTIESSRSVIPWKHDSRLLQYAAVTFDMCYYDCFLAWSLGFALCAAEQDALLNDLTHTINILEVDLLDLTPSVAASLRRTEVPGVKWLYCIGEAMTFEVVRQWSDACVNSYGPTEAAFCTTIFPFDKEIKTSIIGRPFPTTSFAVFPDQGERPVPLLGVGELYIGGAQLARGYYGKPDLTAERFVQKCGQRFYKSGDIVRMLSDGNFEFLGRADDQVKIRGLRVELGEINHVIQDCDDRIAAVTTQILRRSAGLKDQLVSFLVHRDSTDGEERAELRLKAKQIAADQLPAYMVPQFFLSVDEIPRSMAGKVDKKALAEIFVESEEVESSANQSDRDDPEHEWTENESQIRGVLARLSGTPLEDISPWTTIYQLGLDSISAVQIAAALRRQGLPANAADVMKYMNCKDLALWLKHLSTAQPAEAKLTDFGSFEQRHRLDVVRTCNIRDADVEAIRPCTPLQTAMLSRFAATDEGFYFNYLRLQLNAGVDLGRMRGAWEAAVQKHRMLRTGFANIRDNKTPFAMIHYAYESISLPWYDATGNADSVGTWIGKAQRKAAKQLHLPPWCMRIIHENDMTYVDLALLHAIFDAQSLRFIFDDIMRAYNDKSIGIALPLERLLSNIMHSSNAENTQRNAFWVQLSKSAAPTRFPNLSPLRYDPAPPVVFTKFASRTMDELDTGCRRANISLQVAGIASWAALLSAYTGQHAVTFGVVLSGRNIDGADAAVFPCITTVPFACDTSDRKEKVLKDTMALSADIQRHQFTPLNEIQRLIGYPNEPLFDTIFAFQKLAGSNSEHDLWTIVDEKATTEYPISIELEPIGGRLEFRLTFLPHHLPREQAALILEQLNHLLNFYIFADTRLPANATDFQSLYSVTPAKQPTIPSEARLLHQLVERTASKHPDRTALDFATSLHNDMYTSEKWTYRELDREGNRIAHLLTSRGVRPGALVGVCFDKCPEASFAMLGTLKAGCAFLALDPSAPAARKAFMIKDASAKVVLSMKQHSADMEKSVNSTILNLDEVDWRCMSSEKPSLERETDTQDRSYCLYTSGTTGTPKGCELTHENAVQALSAFQRLFAGHWDESSRWLQFASFHFDVSVLEQYWSWSVGICVVSAPRDIIFEDLATSIRTLGITHIDLTPSLARILHPDDVPSLCKGVFITGGESLKQEILDIWGPKGVIYNGYGPTEATIGVTMYPRVPANGKPSNIGPQFDNVGSYILRPGSEVPVLRGGVGELCVSGKLVGKGYLNRADLTNERFPHLERFNERVYRTGDLVRILHDGTFDFLGRADDQVKLRGQRLEIGEINSVIKQSSIAVADVATVVLKHPKQQSEQLVSFIVTGAKARGEANIVLEKSNELANMRGVCQEKLPPYMVPTHFVALTNMPLSTNNKADARRLKDMYEGLTINDLQLLSSVAQAKDEEWSKQEESIRSVLKEVLEIGNDFGKDTSFFELGMDSITVINVSRALKQAVFSRATVSAIMTNATVRRLAKTLSNINSASSDRGSIVAAQQLMTAIQHRHRRSVAEIVFTDARNIEALAPCTPLQQGIIARSLESEQGLYFNTFYFKLAKEIDLEKLQDAWQIVFSSTQILRTMFINTEDGFLQAALRKTHLRLEHVTLQKGTKIGDYLDKRKKDWVQYNQPNMKTPFELLLLRTTEYAMLVVHMFHALYDGNSINLLFKSVWDAYNGRTIRTGPPFQSALAYGPLKLAKGAREFWEKHIADMVLRPLPPLSNQPNKEPTTISRMAENLRDLEVVRRRLNVTAQAVAQACWISVLHQHFKSTLTVGMVVSGRSIDFESADQVIGPLFNTIPYQYRPQQDETWASIIKRAHEFNIAVHPYQHTPLRDIMKWCKRRAGQPLFDTLFVYQIADRHEEWMKNNFWELLDGEAEPDYPLALEVEQRGSQTLKFTLVAQGHILNQKVADELLDHFEAALRGSLRESDATIETFSTDGDEMVHDTTRNNGKSAPTSFDGAKDFEWTSHAKILREELANLAGTQLGDINEATSIFELGLDSIDAIKLSSKLKKRDINLPVSGIMASLTIANMLQHTSNDRKKWSERPSNMAFQSHKRMLESYLQRRGLTRNVEKILPLTPLQEAMVAEMISSEYTRYYNHDLLKLEPDTDIQRLQRAWTEVVEKSPMLRTAFIQIEDPDIDFSFAQVIYEKSHAFWRSSEVGDELNLAAFDSIRQEAIKKPESEPLFHIRLIQSPQETYLVLSIAHALYDGWSLGLLHADVQQAYNGDLKPRPSYEFALHGILTTSGSDAVAFWRDYLSDAKVTSFARHKLSKGHDPHVVHRKEQPSRTSVSEMASFAKRNNITLQTLGQTAYSLLLASYTHSLDVVFGSVLSGRDDDERAKLLFPTMNTVAIRTILHGTRREMLQYVQHNFINIKQWQHFPLRKALNLAGVQGSLFESLFIYQKMMDAGKGKQKKLYKSIQGHSVVEYPVCVEMEVVGEELVWRYAVKEEVFDNVGAQELLDRLDEVLRSIMEQPDAHTINFTAEGTSICGLPAFEDEHARADEESTENEPRAHQRANSTTARAIREVLAFVSKTPEQDITEDMTIFHIGLDSISAVKVSSLLRKRGVVLTVGEMLKASTVDKMAQIVDGRASSIEDEADNSEAVLEGALAGIDRAEVLKRAGMKDTDVKRILPATAGQVYMLSMWIKSGGAGFYPEFTYEVQGSIEFGALRKAWQNLIAANSILRTRFLTTKDEHLPYIQVVESHSEAAVLDITGWADDRISQVKERAPKQPYVRLFALRSSTGWTLQLQIHHALYDGVSLPLLMQQLQDLYTGAELPASSNSPRKFIADTSSTHAHQNRKNFWKAYLKGIVRHALPQPSSAPSYKVEVFAPGLITDVTAVEALARKDGLTMQSLVLAVYAKLYATITSTPKEEDVVIGIYLANRSLSLRDIAYVTIPTVNLVPFRVSAPLETNILDVAAQIQYDIQEISSPANASVSLWEISAWTGVTIDTFVNFLKLPDVDDEIKPRREGVRIVQTGQWNESVSRVTELHTEGFEAPEDLSNERVNEIYLHSLDIEVTVRNGALDVGVFAPQEMLSLQDGENLIEDIKLQLEALEKQGT